jgi:hypothetical protein
VIAQLELDALDLRDDLEILDQLGFNCLGGNGGPPLFWPARGTALTSFRPLRGCR